jgi:hypothetical protein
MESEEKYKLKKKKKNQANSDELHKPGLIFQAHNPLNSKPWAKLIS